MNEINIIRRFDFLNSRSSSKIDSHKKIQEFLYYAESRFWAILNYVTKAASNRNGWCQKLLHRELMLVLRYVGIGASLGHPLNVPILIRSLADSMGHLTEADLPIPFHNDFLSLLDSDLAEQNYICRIVANYQCAWWIGRKPRIVEVADTMKSTSMAQCVEKHLNQLDGSDSDLDRLLNPAMEAPNNSDSNDTQCPRCSNYKQILSDTLQDLLQVHRLTSTVLTGSEAKWHIDMRRASAFHLLHEAIIIKESSGIPSASSNRMTTYSPDVVEAMARRELARLQDQLPTSHKWTWGESLTKSDVLSLRRSGSRRKLHSGYDFSLNEGNLDGQDSALPSYPTTSDHVGDAPFDTYGTQPSLPDYNIPDIQYFRKVKNLLYDPLGKIDTPILPLAPEVSDLSAHNVEIHTKSMAKTGKPSSTAESRIEKIKSAQHRDMPDDIGSSASKPVNPKTGKGKGKQSQVNDAEDMWSSASNSIHNEKDKDIDDMWSSASEAGNNVVAKEARSLKKDKDIDDMWSSASEAGNKVVAEEARSLEKDKDIDDMWSSASEAGNNEEDPSAVKEVNDKTKLPAKDDDMWSSASDVEDIAPLTGAANDVGVNWTSASDPDEDGKSNENHMASSQITVNSRLIVSPSRITIPRANTTFPLSDVWPELISPAPMDIPQRPTGSYRRFGPEDFTNLQDHMFADRDSDSESSEE